MIRPAPFCRASQAQRGQSLVEVAVLGAALVPLLLAVPLLAKYQDIRLAAIAASRNAAFECSVRLQACGEESAQAALTDSLRRRHFARHDRDLLSDDAIASNPPAAERNRFWVDRRGTDLLADFSDVSSRVTIGESDAVQGAWSRGGAGAAAVRASSGLAGPGAFGLDVAGGLVTAEVRARVSLHGTLAQWLAKPQGMALALTGRTAVIVDAWNASAGQDPDPRSFQSRVDSGRRLPSLGEAAAVLAAAGAAAPQGALGPLRRGEPEDLIDALYTPIRMLITSPLLAPVEPRGRLFRYHEIDVELIPQDRLGEEVEGRLGLTSRPVQESQRS